mgnify:CR=1 FL=1
MKKIFLIPLAIFMFSCNTTKKTAETTKEVSTEVKKSNNKLYEILTESAYQGKEEKSFEVIKDKSSLESLYASVNDTEVPEIDFSKSRIVALFLGQRNSGGYQIKVKQVAEKEGKIYVTTEEIKPEGMATMAITNPFTIVKINSTKEIIFK